MMKALEIAEAMGLKLLAGEEGVKAQIKGCYIGDLLSLAMSKIEAGNIWVTVQTNINIVAVATLTEVGAIIIPEGFKLDEDTEKRAKTEGVAIYGTEKTAYEVVCTLAGLLK